VHNLSSWLASRYCETKMYPTLINVSNLAAILILWYSCSLVVPLYFLDRHELWKRIKPYTFHYIPKETFPLHNLKRSPQLTRVRNLRPHVSTLSSDAQGFEVHSLNSRMKISDFKDESIVQTVYIRELEQHFKEALRANEVRGLDFQAFSLLLYNNMPKLTQLSWGRKIQIFPLAAKTLYQHPNQA